MGTIASNALRMLSPAVENRIDRNTAVPSVPPTWRKKVADEVATPISRGSTAFCTARISGCMLPPRPRPNTTMITIVIHIGVSTPIRLNANAPTVSSTAPTTGKIL